MEKGLIRVLAKTLDCVLYEVTSEDEDGDPVKPIHRLRSYHAAQSFLTQHDHVLLVLEEAEDIIPERPFEWLFGGGSDNHGSKAWINRALEENKVPAFWVSKSVRGVDPAYTRRFDDVLACVQTSLLKDRQLEVRYQALGQKEPH